MQYLAALLMGLTLFPHLAVAAGGFFQSCRSSWYMDGKYMIAECKRLNGQYRRTRQDMNLCVTNFRGVLAPANNGYFFNTCHGCSEGAGGLLTADSPPTSSMTCFCKTGYQDYELDTFLDLNSFVENRDGYMFCFGHRSEPI
ncbi:uncharacterized protein B0H64DRAFT_50921 [Chaetomium fimeti]|uniref:Cyanovirin-N domain-containing protein n=1 Tax=Chaetomium fimeti TaxID=1854472 RepID=A0AAE0LMV5_9PEZI|nr:hypothetical protein B0H64DRAFT_50921 [Chaetomium fimeti]